MSVHHKVGEPSRPEILYLVSGAFGQAVADQLHPEFPGAVQDIADGTHPSLWPHADLIVLATASDRPQVADAVDRTAFLRGVPWLPVVGRATEIQVGPVIVPGRTPCHRCSERRRRQHGLVPPTQVAAQRDGGWQPNPPEFALLANHISLAQGLARQALAEVLEVSADADVQATVRLFNVISGSVSSGTVISVDGCDRCRARFGTREETHRALWERLERAISPGGVDATDAVLMAGAAR